jgi:16S rRNA (guanine1516-N2)-methyltransferase
MIDYSLIALSNDTSASAKQAQAQLLSAHLALPMVNSTNTKFKYLLVLIDKGLELRQVGSKAKPIFIDFLSPAANYRRLHGGGRGQLIARAVGIKKNANLSVLDATAGLGQDAFVLACLGCKVHCLERSPIVAALLQDALDRLFAIEEWKNLPLSLTQIDAKNYLSNYPQGQELPDVIYLDPMFPPRSKTALVKKEMRWLQDLLGQEDDVVELLRLALKLVKKRVVVKRPRLAPLLEGPKPSMQICGKSSRFDVYLI